MSLGAAGRLEGFAWEPGRNAGYRVGTNSMEFCAVHFTAGACGGDRAVGLRGYFPLYIPQDPGCGPGATQFAEVDSTNWHICEFNPRGPGIEFEKRHDGIALTDYQITKGASAIRQLMRLGIAGTYRDTPGDRIPVGGAVSGFVSHRSCHARACDEHYDGLPREEMDRMFALAGTVTPPTLSQEDTMGNVLQFTDAGGNEQHYANIGGELHHRYQSPAGAWGPDEIIRRDLHPDSDLIYKPAGLPPGSWTILHTGADGKIGKTSFVKSPGGWATSPGYWDNVTQKKIF